MPLDNVRAVASPSRRLALVLKICQILCFRYVI
jgi:hypothetical protein